MSPHLQNSSSQRLHIPMCTPPLPINSVVLGIYILSPLYTHSKVRSHFVCWREGGGGIWSVCYYWEVGGGKKCSVSLGGYYPRFPPPPPPFHCMKPLPKCVLQCSVSSPSHIGPTKSRSVLIYSWANP